MKYILVCFLLIISCKSAIRDAGNAGVVIGTAVNQKSGAILSSGSGTYVIGGLHSWDSIYLGKTVKVKGNFKFVDWEVDHVKSENPLLNSLQAQTYPKFYSVTNATWELFPDFVIGTAKNDKPGAILSSNSGTYLIAGLHSWDSIYLGKTVKVKGSFKLVVGEDVAYIKDPKTQQLVKFQAQMYPKYYAVTDATWELFPDIVIGTAANMKGGALVRSNDKMYMIGGLHSWDSIYLGKTVKVKGSFKLVVGEDVAYIKDPKTQQLVKFQAQMYPKYYAVTDATWELFPDIVIGTAANMKGGALVRSNDKMYMIGGLQSWDSIYLGKKVKVTGNFTFVNMKDDYKNHEKSGNAFLNSLQAQVPGSDYYSVGNAVWELYKPE